MKALVHDNKAVSTVIAAMLILVIITTFMAAINAYYIPSLGARSEIEHMQEVRQSFYELDANINNYAYQAYISSANGLIAPPDIKVPLALGSKGIQYFTITPSSGVLIANPHGYNNSTNTRGSTMNVTVCYNVSYFDSVNGTALYNESLSETLSSNGWLEYRGLNHFWIDQDFIYEHGALILNQPDNNRSMLISTPFGDPYDMPKSMNATSNASLVFNMYNVSSHRSVGGNANYMILAHVKHSDHICYPPVTNISGPVRSEFDLTNITLNITSRYHSAWYEYFKDFEYSTEKYNITVNDKRINVNCSHVPESSSVVVRFENYTNAQIIRSNISVSYSI